MKRSTTKGAEHERQGGLTLLEVLLVIAMLGILSVAAIPTMQRAHHAARFGKIVADGTAISRAILHFAADHGAPPPAGTRNGSGLNLHTLAPLSDTGYLRDSHAILSHLDGRQITAYDTPGPPERGGFWLIMTDARYRGLQILVASTDMFPLAPDTWLEGIYRIEGGEVHKIEGLPPAPPRDSAALPHDDSEEESPEQENKGV